MSDSFRYTESHLRQMGSHRRPVMYDEKPKYGHRRSPKAGACLRVCGVASTVCLLVVALMSSGVLFPEAHKAIRGHVESRLKSIPLHQQVLLCFECALCPWPSCVELSIESGAVSLLPLARHCRARPHPLCRRTRSRRTRTSLRPCKPASSQTRKRRRARLALSGIPSTSFSATEFRL